MLKHELKIAFLVTDFFSHDEKSNPDYFKWDVKVVKADGNSDKDKTEIGIHRCNDEDWEQFDTPNTRSISRYEAIKNN